MGDKLSRRGFVGAAAGTAAATAFGPWSPVAAAHGKRKHGGGDRLLPKRRIGIQLYTVRDQVASQGFDAVFATLAEQGYKEVEFAGYEAQGRRWSNQELRRFPETGSGNLLFPDAGTSVCSGFSPLRSRVGSTPCARSRETPERWRVSALVQR